MDIAKLGSVGPRMQKLLWLCLLGFTIGIILWPVAPSLYDPLPMQSIYAIKHLSWFIVLFMAWVFSLATLLFFAKGGIWERLALCLVFMVVLVQFWGLACPWGISVDSSFLMGHVNYLEHTAKIPAAGHHALRYFDSPGLTFIALATKQLSGADLFLAIRIYLLFSGLIFVVILYVFFLKLLKAPYLAALGVVLALLGSNILCVMWAQFHPINLATIFIVTFLLLLVRGTEGFSEQGTVIIFLLLIMASAVEYIFTPVLFFMILLASYIINRMTKARGNISLTTALLPLVLFLSWEIYWAVWMFRSAVQGFPAALKAILNGGWLVPTTVILEANFGTTYPWWGNATHLFWWLSVFGFGTLLMLWRLLRWRQADSSRRMQIAIFVGILATVIVGSFAVGVISVIHGGIIRYIWVAPLVLVPALIGFLADSRRRYLAIVFSIVGILLVLPTFLSNADNISADYVYRNEIAAFEFINSSHGEGEELTIYGFSLIPSVSFIYVPDARLYSGLFIYAGVIEAPAMLTSLKAQAKLFFASNPEATLAITSVKGKVEWERYLQIPVDHPNWLDIELRLSAGNRVYDNGYIELYAPH